MGQCYLPESIRMADLSESKPLQVLVWDVSIMVDCYVNRSEQIKQLEVFVFFLFGRRLIAEGGLDTVVDLNLVNLVYKGRVC